MIEKILSVTDRGKDIILYYLPQSRLSFDSHKLFKMRPSERTASASVYFAKESNQWKVTDFGDEGTALSCFEVAMRAERMNFREIINILSERYGIGQRLKENVNISKNEFRDATPEEVEGYEFTYKKEPTKLDLQVFGETVTNEVLRRYNYYSVEYYKHTYQDKKTGNLKTLIVKSNDNYPIFVHEVNFNGKIFKKIYSPLSFDKSKRFFSVGEKPENYINGLEVLINAYNELNRDIVREEGQEAKKLQECIICSGERDAINVASLGYYPIWLNSETAKIQEYQFAQLKKMCEKIYNVPDIDETGISKGKELALQYLDIYTVILPERLKSFIDNRGRKAKDLRDYLSYNPTEYDFKKLLTTAQSCKFWENKIYRGKPTLSINTEYLLYYLYCNGFAKIVDKKNTKYVKIDRYIVTEVTAKDIRNFVYNDLKSRYIDNEIINLYLNSNKTDARLADDLPTVSLSFQKFTHNSRSFFFKNKSITVYSNKIEDTDNNDIDKFVWSENICNHNFDLLEKKQFNFTFNKDNSCELEIDIPYSDMSNYFKFLLNASRIYWRKEYEDRATGNEQKDNEYREIFKFSIWGSRLTEDEKNEQQLHLMNKIFSIGYLLHRYKKKSRAYALWLMENKLTDANESSGGSGKSFSLDALKMCGLINIATLNGRDKKITENKHLLDRVDTITDCIQIDDTDKSFDFNYFYGMITNSTSVNKKNQQSEEIDFKDAPIFAFTSNFPPPNSDGSTMRRLLTMVYSDYYHDKGINKYNETRKISDDFGFDLFDELYSEKEYNKDINFFVQCLQFYLSASEKGLTFLPPMDNVIKRMNIQKMGDEFRSWAEVYFSPESGNLDVLLTKTTVFTDFINTTGLRKWTTNRFSKSLAAFCENNYLVLNPDALCNSKGRIIKNVNGSSKECVYLQTVGFPINYNIDKLV